MKKKIISVILTLVMVFTLFPITAFAGGTHDVYFSAGTTDEVKYMPNDKKNIGGDNWMWDIPLVEVDNVSKAPERSGYIFLGWDVDYYNTSYNDDFISFDHTTQQYSKKLWIPWDYHISLTAKWEKLVTVTYADGGNGVTGMPSPISVSDLRKGTNYTVSSTKPSRTGYDFAGWNDGSNTVAAGATITLPSSDLTLTAEWTEHTATLSYNANGHGTAPSSVTMKYSQATNAASALSATGYTFNGWNTAANGTGTSYAAGGQVKAANADPSAMTLFAKWSPNQYTVTLNANGGSGGTASVTATYNDNMPTGVTMPTKPGYTCTGYYDSTSDGNQYYDSNAASMKKWQTAGSGTLYAHWYPIQYTTQYWSQDDRDVAKNDAAYVDQQTFVYGSFTPKSAVDLNLTREHYDFIGWNTYQEQDWAMYQAGKTYSGGLSTVSQGTAILYAAWKEKPQFTVTYNANGGTGAPANDSVYRDDDYTVSSTVPARDGYTFTGWLMGNDAYSGGDEIKNVQGNITLVAKWQRNNSVGYHPNGGSYPLAPTTLYPAKNATVNIDFTNVPTRDGYTFKGYATDPGATSASYTASGTKSFTMGDAGVTLYAVWGPESYGISYTGCDGRYTFDGAKPESVECDADYTFKLKIENTYNTDNLSVTVNGIVVPYTGVTESESYTVFTYTVKGVKGVQSVVISGIASTPQKITYELNGGTIDGKYATYYENGVGATLPTSEQITRTGHTFGGWYDNVTFEGNPVTTIATTETGEKTFYAKWTANSYTIHYDANGGSSAPADANTSYDTVTALAAQGSMTYAGYTFLGWDEDADAVAPTYQAGDSVKNLTAVSDDTVTLYAIWNVERHNVIFHLNGGVIQNTFALTQSVKHGGKITTPAGTDLKKTGNEFKGWATSEGSAVVAYGHSAEITVNDDLNLYAIWQAGTYTITYYNGENTVGQPQEMTFGTPATLEDGESLEAPESKEFLGWSRNATAITAEFVGGQKVTAIGDGTDKEINLYAVWGDKTAKYLTYNANGGNWIGGVPESIVDYGDGSVTLESFGSEKLSCPGYTRDGWLIGDKKYADGETIIITKNTNVFANWVANTYTVKFNANGGDGVTANMKMTYDEEAALSTNGFIRNGYTFKGWARSASGPLVLVDGQTVLNLTNTANGEVTLYAVWEAIDPAWITYHANGGMKAPEAASFAKGTTATVASSTPTLTGYTFVKWNTKADGTGTDYASGATFTISENITLYAVWQAKTVYHVTYDLNGGTSGLIVDPKSYYEGDTVTVRTSPEPYRSGYTFAGWKITGSDTIYSADGTTTFTVANTMNPEIVLTAQWTVRKYKLSFSFSADEFVYDGCEKPVTVLATDDDNRVFTNYTVYYTGINGTNYTKSTIAPVNAGTYQVSAEFSDTTHYELSSTNCNITTLTINKANVVTLTMGGTTHSFEDADKSVNVTSVPNLALKVTYYSVDSQDKVASSAESGVPSAVGKYLYVITLADNETNKNYEVGNALSGAPTGKTVNTLVGSNFGVMTIGKSAQKPLSFANEIENKLTTDSAFINILTNPNSDATTTFTSSDTSVAEVNETTGEVTIKGAGSATITAKSVLTGYTDAYASYTLNVDKEVITVTVNPKSVIYGDAMPYSAITDVTFAPSISTDGLGTPTFTTTYQVGSSIGEYAVCASGLTSDKYSFVYEPGTLTVNPKTLNVENFTVTAANKVYDGTTAATVTAVTQDGLVSDDTLTVTATGSFENETVGAGKTVNYTITGISGVKANNYVLGTTESTTTANITKMPITFSFGTSEFSYDGSKKVVAVSAVDKDNRVFTDYTVEYTGTGDTTYNKSATAPKNVGTYTVTAVYDTSKYECTSNTTTLTITRGNAVVWASGGIAHSFGDLDKSIAVTSVPNLALTVTYYTISTDGTVGNTVTVPDTLGRYLYVITLTANETNSNYVIGGALEDSPVGKNISEIFGSNIGIMTVENSVQPELVANQSVVTKSYGDAPFSVAVTGGVSGATITYSIPNAAEQVFASVNATTGEITILKPGTVVIEARASKTGYTDAVTYFTVIIEKRLVDITLADEIVYAGETITAPYTVTNDVEGNRIAADDIQFFYQSRFDETIHDFRNVDAYYVTAEIPSSNEYYRTNGAVSQLINITRAPLTVTADDQTVTYGDAAPTYTVSYTPLGDDTSLGGSAKYVCSYKQYDDAGNYDIGVYGLFSPNYDITFKPGKLTVNPKPVTLNWSNDSFVYDGEEHGVTAKVTNAVNWDCVNVTSYTGNKGTNAGSYTATATALNNSNYTLTGGTNLSTSWQIAPKPVTVKPADIWFFANGSTPELTLDLSNLPDGYSYTGDPTFKITNESGEISLNEALQTAGVYTITWTNPGNVDFGVNYAVSAMPGTLTVNTYSGGCKAAVSLKDNGEYGLKLGGVEIGEFTFTKSGSGWTIKNADGKYLGFANKSLTYTTSSFEWKYTGGRFQTSVTTTSGGNGWGWLFGGNRTTTTTYYLAYVDGKLTVSTATTGADATFVKWNETANHTFGNWTTDKDSTQHYRVCSFCGEKEYANCVYDPGTHLCVCGRIDPDLVYVTATFVTGEGASTAPKAQTVIQDEGLIARPVNDPTKIGFIFDDWYVGDTDNKFTFDTAISEDVNITAKWTECDNHTYDENDICTKCGLHDPTKVPQCITTKTAALKEGDLIFTLGGHTFEDEYTFAKSGNGWMIKNADGKYLVFANNALTYANDLFVWTFSNNRFSATTTTSSNSGWSWNRSSSRTTTYYLVYTGGELTVSTSTNSATASFAEKLESLNHTFGGVWTTDKNSEQHYRVCSVCGEKEYANCVYNQEGHKCICGRIDPNLVYVTATFETGEGASTAPKAQTVIQNEGLITRPETAPTKIGFLFDDWYVGDTDNKFTFDTEISENVIIKAKWTECNEHDYDEETHICSKCGLKDPEAVAHCSGDKTVSLTAGELLFTLGGHDLGEFTFTKGNNNTWTIKDNAKDKYLGFVNNAFAYVDAPFNWTFSNNRFQTSVTTTSGSNGGWGWFFGGSRTTTTTYYLVYSNGNITVSTSTSGANASFKLHVESDEHSGAWKTVGKTHTRKCEVCGETETENCTYGADHRCTVCGGYDPDYVVIHVSVSKSQRTSGGNSGWWGFGWGGSSRTTTYTATINATATGATVAKVEYSTNGGTSWTSGNTVTSNSQIGAFLIRVTDSNGTVHNYSYDGEDVSEN